MYNTKISIIMIGLLLTGTTVGAEKEKSLDFHPGTGWASLFDGKSLGHWQPTDFFGKSKVHIMGGALHLEAGNDLTGVTWNGPLERINYEIELEAKRVSGTDFFCGLTVPMGDQHFSLILGGWGGNLVGISCVDFYDAANNLTCTDRHFDQDHWYTIRLQVTEQVIRAWIDDEQIIEQVCKGHQFSVRHEVELSRPLGIATWQTHGAVRHIRIRKIKSAPPFLSTDSYLVQNLEGWNVYISEPLYEEHEELQQKSLRLLQNHLYRIKRALPPHHLKKLQSVKIWLELGDTEHRGMCYHPSKRWLLDHGYNPDKAKSIEISNAQNFLDWSLQQPWMVLHEMAHAFHHQVLGHDYQPLKKAYNQAKKEKAYDPVLHISGRTKPHYALNNPKEYFAEGTEAYFGTNDFYPFVKAELKQHDPALYKLLGEIWK